MSELGILEANERTELIAEQNRPLLAAKGTPHVTAWIQALFFRHFYAKSR